MITSGHIICNFQEHKKPKRAVLTIYAHHSEKNWRGNITVTNSVKTLCKKCLGFCLKIGQVSIEV